MFSLSITTVKNVEAMQVLDQYLRLKINQNIID